MALPRCSSLLTLVLISFVLILSVFPRPVIADSLVKDFKQADVTVNDVASNTTVLDTFEQKQAVKIDGTSLMQPINQALKQRFEQDYPEADITLQTSGTEAALDALLGNDIDLAAIARPLSADEKAKGLVEIQVGQDSKLLDALPSDQYYPYPQIRIYAYNKNNTATVLPFINWVKGESGTDTIAAAKEAEAEAINLALNPPPPAIAEDTATRLPSWLWGLLPLPLLLFFLGWRRQESSEEITTSQDNQLSQPVQDTVEPATSLSDSAAETEDTVEPAPCSNDSTSGTKSTESDTSVAVSEKSKSVSEQAVSEKTAVEKTTESEAKSDSTAISENRGNPDIKSSSPPPAGISTTPISTTELPPPPPAAPPNVLITVPTPKPAVIPYNQTDAWNNFNLVYQKSLGCLNAGQLSDAELYFQRAVELSPREILAIIGLGNVFLKQKQGENALTQFNRAIEIVPADPTAWLGKGKALQLLGQLDSALTSFDQAFQLDKTSTDALRAKGDILLALGQQQEANRCYDEANTIQAGTPIPVWTYSADEDNVTSAPPDASASTDVPTDTPTTDAAVDTTGTSKGTPSVSSPPPAVYTDWTDLNKLYQQGLTYLTYGQFTNAESCFRRMIELDPNNRLGMIGLGKVFLKSGQLEKALTQFNQILESDPSEYDAWIGRGDAFMLQGQFDKGKDNYAKAVILRSKAYQSILFKPTPAIPTVDNQSGSGTAETITPNRPELPSMVPAAPPQLLDLVILVDTQSPLQATVMAIQQSMAAAIIRATSVRPADMRITWLGTHSDTHSNWGQTPVQQSVVDYLASLGTSSNQVDIGSAAHAISVLTECFDWRPGAAQSLLYVGHGPFCKDSQTDSQTALQSIIKAAKDTGTTVNTYLCVADLSLDSPAAVAALMADYSQLAISTGGQAFTDLESSVTCRNILEQTIERSCRECIHRRLKIHSQRHCYRLDPDQISRLKTKSTPLAPGRYIIRINSGSFSYQTENPRFESEPWVNLWIYGGRFINQKTNSDVDTTWVTLNGYDDILKLDVIEATNLCALFLDTCKIDNAGQINLSILKSD